MKPQTDTSRGAYDLTMRHLAQWFPKDLVFLSLGRVPDEIEILNPDLPASERRGDWLVKVRIGEEVLLLQVEFQTAYSAEKILAMLEYRIRARVLFGLPVLSVVIYLSDEGYPGPGQNRFEETVLGHRQHFFEFIEVALWQLDASDMLNAGREGIIPLLPLMKGETDEQPLSLAVEAATRMQDTSNRSNLLAALAMLGGLRYSGDLIAKLIRREEMKESTIYMEILEEGREEGLAKGLERGLERGLEKGALIGQIQTCQRVLKQPISSLADLQEKPETELHQMAESLEAEISKL